MDPDQLELFEFVADKAKAWKVFQKMAKETIDGIYRSDIDKME